MVQTYKIRGKGKILNIIQSMYTCVKSRIKFLNRLSEDYTCALGVRQGESLSPFLFSIYINDLEDEFIKGGIDGIDVDMFKMFLLLYADDIVIFAKSAMELQSALDMLFNYYNTLKLKVNIPKTKIMVFKRGGRL